jgi:uncharacterized RDD family membrane protein YckC
VEEGRLTQHGIVTPEAVPLEFEAAGIGSRAVALVIDLIVQGTALLALLFATMLIAGAGAAAGLPGWVAVSILLLSVFLILFGYPTALETLWRGRTLGKAAMGLRVVTVEGAPIRFRHAAIRAALGLIDIYASSGGIAVLSALLSSRHQRLGDLAAGTIVLRERTGSAAPVVMRFAVPPGAEGYAATIDPAGLSAAEYQAVRTFLARAPQLAPAVREELATSIAQPVAAKLRHVPPPGVSPELFLACVAARYQQRGAVAPGGFGDPGHPPPPGTDLR